MRKFLPFQSLRDSCVKDHLYVKPVVDPEMAKSSSNPVVELNGQEFWPLSGKPYFDVILTKSHVKPIYQLGIPAKLEPVLPSGSIHTVLTFGAKSWEMTYNGEKRHKQFDRKSWGAFVDENNLKAGDGLVFELKECNSTQIGFRVQILRGDIPDELLEKANCEAEKPIFIQ
ncbi:B3 domain-containing protein Os04g0386900-like isoform X1 [Rosa chinensis]|nr:B3 domain-containing protein Os04g0386900-like isoform X1 [Rosa chinensis]